MIETSSVWTEERKNLQALRREQVNLDARAFPDEETKWKEEDEKTLREQERE